MMQSPMTKCIAFGGPGVGKSNVLNFILDGCASNSFRSSKSAESGVTQNIQSLSGKALGIPTQRSVLLIDLPGIGDPKIDQEPAKLSRQ